MGPVVSPLFAVRDSDDSGGLAGSSSAIQLMETHFVLIRIPVDFTWISGYVTFLFCRVVKYFVFGRVEGLIVTDSTCQK